MSNNQNGLKFGYPRLGSPTNEVLVGNNRLDEQRPLPSLIEPDEIPMMGTDQSALVRVEGMHELIKVVPHYQFGGWVNSIGECWLRPEVAMRVVSAVEKLPPGFGFIVYDGWRPRELQNELYEWALLDPLVAEDFLAKPTTNPTLAAPHETGGAIDLALTFNGTPIAPGTDFDDFTDQAFAEAIEDQPGQDREARRLLFWAMQGEGFVTYKGEWWHYEYGTRRWSSITGEEIRYSAIAPVAS